MTEPLHLFSRSDIEEYWRCPRASYWKRIYAGRGLEPAQTDMAFTFGIILHHAVAEILKGGDPRKAASDAGKLLEAEARIAGCPQWIVNADGDPTYYFREQASLIEGMVLGWERVIHPMLMSMGTIEVIEKETMYQEGGLALLATPDILLLPHGNEEFTYIEWKTTASASASWFMSWTTAPQFAANALTVEQTYGKTIDQYMVVGLIKGSWNDGWQHSPYCWGWKFDTPDGGAAYEYEFKNARKKGWYRFPVWEYPGGVAQWVEDMPIDCLTKEFPCTVPIPVDLRMVESFKQQVFNQEDIVFHAKRNLEDPDLLPVQVEYVMNHTFPQHFKECNPPFGRGCWAKELCWQHAVANDPFAGGQFVWRTSHHEMEQKRLKLKGVGDATCSGV
jgi:hypothetical protein